MSVFEAAVDRRSIRQYKKGEIDAGALQEMMMAAQLAPSWKNQQCFCYILLEDREVIRQIGEITNYNPTQSAYEDAQYFLILCADPDQSGHRDHKPYYMTDAAISMQQMMLVAAEHHVGMCWIGAFLESPIKRLLQIPEEIRIVGMSPIGIPNEAPMMRPRRPLDEVFFYHRYGEKRKKSSRVED